jgi:hypothetical protein
VTFADAKSGGEEPDRGLSSPLAGRVEKLLQGRAEALRSVGVRLLIRISGGDEPDRGLSSPLAGMVVKLLQGRAEVLRSVGVRLLIPISEGAEAPRPGHSLQLDAELRSLALLL